MRFPMGTSIKETLYEVKTFPVPLKTGSDHNPSSSGIEDKENKFPMGTRVKETLYEEKNLCSSTETKFWPHHYDSTVQRRSFSGFYYALPKIHQLVKYCHTKGNFNRECKISIIYNYLY